MNYCGDLNGNNTCNVNIVASKLDAIKAVDLGATRL